MPVKKPPTDTRPVSEAERRALLTRLAARHVIHTSDAAAGRCFVASLEFAHAAREVEDVRLLRWRVRNDPDFNEHWAVRLSADEVLDVTRVQVDGKVPALKSIASYPASYRLMGEYPASMLLAHVDGLPDPAALTTVSLRNALAMRRAIHRQDAGVAGAGPVPVRLRWAAWANFGHFFFHALAARFHLALLARRRQLAARLDGKR